MIEIKDKKDCVGCTACAGICPKKCILMQPDEEGFLYPVVDKSRCVECNACNMVCPIQSPVTEEEKQQKEETERERIEAKRAERNRKISENLKANWWKYLLIGIGICLLCSVLAKALG